MDKLGFLDINILSFMKAGENRLKNRNKNSSFDKADLKK